MCACGLLFLIACDDSRPLPTSASPASATPTTTSAPFRVGCPLPCLLCLERTLSQVWLGHPVYRWPVPESGW